VKKLLASIFASAFLFTGLALPSFAGEGNDHDFTTSQKVLSVVFKTYCHSHWYKKTLTYNLNFSDYSYSENMEGGGVLINIDCSTVNSGSIKPRYGQLQLKKGEFSETDAVILVRLTRENGLDTININPEEPWKTTKLKPLANNTDEFRGFAAEYAIELCLYRKDAKSVFFDSEIYNRSTQSNISIAYIFATCPLDPNRTKSIDLGKLRGTYGLDSILYQMSTQLPGRKITYDFNETDSLTSGKVEIYFAK
jgi:hypothetical protein